MSSPSLSKNSSQPQWIFPWKQGMTSLGRSCIAFFCSVVVCLLFYQFIEVELVVKKKKNQKRADVFILSGQPEYEKWRTLAYKAGPFSDRFVLNEWLPDVSSDYLMQPFTSHSKTEAVDVSLKPLPEITSPQFKLPKVLSAPWQKDSKTKNTVIESPVQASIQTKFSLISSYFELPQDLKISDFLKEASIKMDKQSIHCLVEVSPLGSILNVMVLNSIDQGLQQEIKAWIEGIPLKAKDPIYFSPIWVSLIIDFEY